MTDENHTPLTMKDIARELGVSVSTVSRALQNSTRISAEIRERIKRYATDNGFRPNIMAGFLRTQKAIKLIGVIVPEFAHFYFSSILGGIEEEADKKGFRLMVAQSGDSYEKEVELCQSFYNNRVCGIIVSQAKGTSDYKHFQQLLDRNVPIVFYDRICTGVNASRVTVDDYTGAFAAVDHLVKTGCRRIAFYGSPMKLEISKNRYNGYRDALLKNGITPDDSLSIICDNREDALRLTPEIMNREASPDSFFAVNDDTAIGIMFAIKRMGLRIPEDISICGFTNGQRAIACDPMLTTVEQRGPEVGRQAADILIGKVEGTIPMEKVERRIVRTKLIIRGTTRDLLSNG